jgi:hypothetical protein
MESTRTWMVFGWERERTRVSTAVKEIGELKEDV